MCGNCDFRGFKTSVLYKPDSIQHLNSIPWHRCLLPITHHQSPFDGERRGIHQTFDDVNFENNTLTFRSYNKYKQNDAHSVAYVPNAVLADY